MQSALKMAAPLKLKLLPDERFHDIFEMAVRGGVASVMKRFGSANQPDLPGYDPAQPRRSMIYLDAVNLVSTRVYNLRVTERSALNFL